MFASQRYLDLIDASGAILIVRVADPDEAYRVSSAAIRGGVTTLEITLSVPGAIDVIHRLAREHAAADVLVGAGTVLDRKDADAAIEAGARLLVSPHVCAPMLQVGRETGAVTIGGAFTPSEIVQTAQAGADIVKLFPAEFFGPAYLKTVLAPLAGTPIAPTGGVTTANVHTWFEAGARAVGVGSAITKAGSDDDVTAAAAEFLAAVATART